MDVTRILALLSRCLLVISLIAGPPVALAKGTHAEAKPAAAETMPCHAEEVPPIEPPCDDGCCAMPDCDPQHCSLATPGLVAVAVLIPVAAAVPLATAADAAAPSAAPPTERLRPPIV